ncbi:MAG: hypothetical protein QOJ64_1626 [Acidobacteriota bacterium]|jgi:hypothetical protein|nr:hypothetical protein [Acidobacteriota bacterium]
MEEHDVQTSPQFYARIGGVLYLIIIIIGSVGELFLRDSMIVSGDATETAQRIMSSQSLWREGTAAEYFLLICAVPLLLILYRLLKPVSRDLALLAVFFNLVSITIEAVTSLSLMQTLSPLANANYLKVLDPQQLHALAYLSIRSHEDGFGVSLIFFGCFCLVVGYLILKSGYLPKVIGVLMQIAGLCYLTNSFALILSPALAGRLFPTILLPALVGEASLCLWLLVKGVNVSKWKARVSAKPALSTLSGA